MTIKLLRICSLPPRPDLAAVPRKVVYFHENQLIYPVRERKDRDFQYGYNQILTALTADEVIFNSEYNMNSFLQNLDVFFKLQPDHRDGFLSPTPTLFCVCMKLSYVICYNIVVF